MTERLTMLFTWVKKQPELLILSLCLIFSYWLMSYTFGYEAGKLVLASKVYSDFAAHIPLIRSFSLGNNFPPEYPFFAGEPIRYHYLFYLLVGLLEKIGLNIALSLNLLSALGFGLLLFLIYKLSFLFFKKHSVGILAIVLFLFNGSLSFLEFFKKNSFLNVLKAQDFASFGPWDGKSVSAFWNLNIYTNQRHLGFSYALFLLLIYLLIKNKLNKKYYLWILLGFILFPFLHQAVFIMLVLFSFGWGFLYRKKLSKLIIFYLISSLLSLFIFKLFGPKGTNEITWQLGFLAKNQDFLVILKYWFNNLGLYLFLAPALILKSKGNYQKFLLITYGYFVLANLFKFSVEMAAAHKFINIFILGLNIGVANLLIKFFRKNIYKKVLVLLVFILLTFSGFVDFWPILNDRKVLIKDKTNITYWIKENTDIKDIFLTNTYLYNPASLAGRKLYLDYGYFTWSIGYDTREKRKLLSYYFSSKPNLRRLCSYLNQNNLDFILLSPKFSDLENININKSFIYKSLEPEFISQQGYRVYRVSKFCYTP
jgi:hypothetical protein